MGKQLVLTSTNFHVIKNVLLKSFHVNNKAIITDSYGFFMNPRQTRYHNIFSSAIVQSRLVNLGKLPNQDFKSGRSLSSLC